MPFQAKTGTPLGLSGVPSRPTATAAAAWSWVEKMLHEAQRTSAPRSMSVSMSTAVWTVMCKASCDPGSPASGRFLPVALAKSHQARHLVLGKLDFLAAECGEGQVRHLEVLLCRHVAHCVDLSSLRSCGPCEPGS